MKKFYFIILFIFVNTLTFAEPDGTLYHCPLLSDIKYINGYGAFKAETNYNGLQTGWYSQNFFPYNNLVVKELYAIRRTSCYGKLQDRCEIECIYTATKETSFSLFIDFNNYLSDYVGEGNWTYGNGRCESNDPLGCMFYLSPHN